MNEPTAPNPPSSASAPRPEGGEQRRLDRAPGERYATSVTPTEDGPTGDGPKPPAAGAHAGPLIVAVLVANVGALLFFGLGQVDLGAGLLAVAAFLGWATALALVWRGREAAIGDRRIRAAMAAVLGGWAVAGGILLDWLYALVQGGVLGPLDYAVERYGLVGPLAIAIAAVVALVRAR